MLICILWLAAAVVSTTRRRVTFGGVRRRRRYAADRKLELPLIAAGYSDAALRAMRLDGQDDTTGDESDCTAGGDLRLYYDCKRPLHCYQVALSLNSPVCRPTQSLKTCLEARTCLENGNPCLEKSGSVLQFYKHIYALIHKYPV